MAALEWERQSLAGQSAGRARQETGRVGTRHSLRPRARRGLPVRGSQGPQTLGSARALLAMHGDTQPRRHLPQTGDWARVGAPAAVPSPAPCAAGPAPSPSPPALPPPTGTGPFKRSGQRLKSLARVRGRFCRGCRIESTGKNRSGGRRKKKAKR